MKVRCEFSRKGITSFNSEISTQKETKLTGGMRHWVWDECIEIRIPRNPGVSDLANGWIRKLRHGDFLRSEFLHWVCRLRHSGLVESESRMSEMDFFPWCQRVGGCSWQRGVQISKLRAATLSVLVAILDTVLCMHTITSWVLKQILECTTTTVHVSKNPCIFPRQVGHIPKQAPCAPTTTCIMLLFTIPKKYGSTVFSRFYLEISSHFHLGVSLQGGGGNWNTKVFTNESETVPKRPLYWILVPSVRMLVQFQGTEQRSCRSRCWTTVVTLCVTHKRISDCESRVCSEEELENTWIPPFLSSNVEQY